MRTEQEMLDLILNTAKEDERIHAVIMNGSRANKNVSKDCFQDYDIVYLVTETASFINDKYWIKRFGEPIVFQFPDELDSLVGIETHFEQSYGYLMQFNDGNRIDLTIQTYESVVKRMNEDTLTIVLLDKDNNLPKVPVATDESYWVKKPTQQQISKCTNEYWWVMLYIAKGLWRNEILFALDHLNHYVRPELYEMITWYAGIKTGFSCSVGKCGKYLDKYIPSDIWNRYLKTYPVAEETAIWDAVFVMNDLFLEVSDLVTKELGLTYDIEEGKRSYEFAKFIRMLPKDAKEIQL